MLETLIKFSFFIGVGVAWRFAKPMQISAEALRDALLAVLYLFFIPALVLSVLWQAKFGENTFRVLLIMLATAGVGLAAAWYSYKKIAISNNTKGAFILAAVFGSVIVVGAPITQSWVANWTIRTAVYFEAIVLLPLLFTVGVILAKKLGSASGNNMGINLIKEPIIAVTILGLVLNLAHVKPPIFVADWLNIAKLGVLPIGLLVVGLSLSWKKQWQNLIPVMLPATAIQLVLLPIVLWACFHMFGVTGPQTFKSMFLQAAMPSMVFGFIVCKRFKFDCEAYAASFSFTTVVSIITLPIWWSLIKSGTIS